MNDRQRLSLCSDETLTPLVAAVNIDSWESLVLVDADDEGREGAAKPSGCKKSAANVRSLGSWMSLGAYNRAMVELQI